MSEPERTADGRYVVVDGRRWRATDPQIPDRFRQELVEELMSARRAVRDRAGEARARVQDAKVALGERGEPWWEQPSEQGRADRLAATVRALLRHRRTDATICPSDVARVVGGKKWRLLLDPARAVIAQLAADGVVRVTQRGGEVELGTARGPVRVGRGARWDPGSSDRARRVRSR